MGGRHGVLAARRRPIQRTIQETLAAHIVSSGAHEGGGCGGRDGALQPLTLGFPDDTFRVLKEKGLRRFGEYRTSRLVLEAWERMQSK